MPKLLLYSLHSRVVVFSIIKPWMRLERSELAQFSFCDLLKVRENLVFCPGLLLKFTKSFAWFLNLQSLSLFRNFSLLLLNEVLHPSHLLQPHKPLSFFHLHPFLQKLLRHLPDLSLP